MSHDDIRELILFQERFHPSTGPESPFILPSEGQTERSGPAQQEQDKKPKEQEKYGKDQ